VPVYKAKRVNRHARPGAVVSGFAENTKSMTKWERSGQPLGRISANKMKVFE